MTGSDPGGARYGFAMCDPSQVAHALEAAMVCSQNEWMMNQYILNEQHKQREAAQSCSVPGEVPTSGAQAWLGPIHLGPIHRHGWGPFTWGPFTGMAGAHAWHPTEQVCVYTMSATVPCL